MIERKTEFESRQHVPRYENRAEDMLTESQIIAVGKVLLEWAMLEFAVYRHGANICQLVPLDFGRLTGKPDASAMADRLMLVAPHYLHGIADPSYLEAILKRIAPLSKKRNHFSHGIWETGNLVTGNIPAMPIQEERASSFLIKNYGKSSDFLVFETIEMHELADDIAQVRFDLNRFVDALPFPIGRDMAKRLPPTDKWFLPMPDWEDVATDRD